MEHPFPAPITVLGTTRCPGTAVLLDRLSFCGIPFTFLDIDADESAARRLLALHGGRRATPTLVFGSDDYSIGDPSLETLDVLLSAAGYRYARPTAVLEGPAGKSGRGTGDEAVALERIAAMVSTDGRGTPVAVFAGHRPWCRACVGYTRHLARAAKSLPPDQGTVLVLAGGSVDDEIRWQASVGTGQLVIVHDADGVATDPAAPATIRPPVVGVVDRSLELQLRSTADEAGGLIDPADVIAAMWLLAAEAAEERATGFAPEPALA